MNYATLEQSLQLKDTGFPQPEMAIGQVWYSPKGNPHLIIGERIFEQDLYYSNWSAISLTDGNIALISKQPAMNDGSTFAPTPADILKELGEKYLLSTNGSGAFITQKRDRAENSFTILFTAEVGACATETLIKTWLNQ